MDQKRIFVNCKLCGKRLIERLPNGLWRFCFGKNKDQEFSFIPIEMVIYGSLKMRCIRKECRRKNPDYWNALHYFPATNLLTLE